MIPLTIVIANTGIPFFATYTAFGFLLLIPIIIIEAILLKKLLKRKWLETLGGSALANVASTIAGIALIFIEIGIYELSGTLAGIIILTIFVFAALLTIIIEYPVYRLWWKDIPKRKLLKTVITVNLITYIVLIVTAMVMPYFTEDRTREKARRISCQSNLKQIGLSLKQYAMDYNDWLPDESGGAGLEQLRSNDYLTDYEVYHCPSSKSPKGESNQKLNDKIVDYIYRAGLKDPPVNCKDSSKIPVIWDKPTNHKNYGNVLFLDGHVKGFKGKGWMAQAGINNTANEKSK